MTVFMAMLNQPQSCVPVTRAGKDPCVTLPPVTLPVRHPGGNVWSLAGVIARWAGRGRTVTSASPTLAVTWGAVVDPGNVTVTRDGQGPPARMKYNIVILPRIRSRRM